MKTPLFITSSLNMLPNWVEAFPDATHSTGIPKAFDRFDEAVIFLDYMNLSDDKKHDWLTKCVATGRRVFVLNSIPSESEALNAIRSGAVGYGHTLAVAGRLREMALVVNHGGLWVGNKLMKRVMMALGQPIHQQNHSQNDNVKPTDLVRTLSSELTQRELAVANLVARGQTNAEISVALDIKERTVKAHITSAFEKLNVRNRVELALLLHNIQLSPQSIGNQSNRPAL